jgi:hypothetical protein
MTGPLASRQTQAVGSQACRNLVGTISQWLGKQLSGPGSPRLTALGTADRLQVIHLLRLGRFGSERKICSTAVTRVLASICNELHMEAGMVDSGDVLDRVGLGAEGILGYFYTGALLGFLWWKLRTPEVQEFASSMGGLVYALGTLMLGVGVYVASFRFIGEFILFPLQHLIHEILDTRLLNRASSESTSPIRLLQAIGVDLGHRRFAYNSLKDELLLEQRRSPVALIHAEVGMLYVTAIELLGAALVVAFGWSQPFSASPLLLVGSLSLMAALASDTKQHVQEAAQLRQIGAAEVTRFLTEKGVRVARASFD